MRKHGKPPASTRREFLRAASATAAGLAATGMGRAVPGAAAGVSGSRAREAPPGRQEPWGRLEPVAPGAWALLSTPLVDHPDARRTLCNGGIIAGEDGVMAVEGLASVAGAEWLARQALLRTGSWPTHVVITHFHGDHSTGTAGYLTGASGAGTPGAGASGDGTIGAGPSSASIPAVLATETTRRILAEREAELPPGRGEARLLVLPDTLVPDSGPPREVDLGGRVVRLVPLGGHTPSDLAVELRSGDDPAGRVVWCGDLVWTGMFPNYMDAIPSWLSESVRALRNMDAATWVSGHGTLARHADLDVYLDLLEDVEAAARRAIESGTPLDEAGAAYRVPPALGEWHMFSPRYPEVAFRAWARELGS